MNEVISQMTISYIENCCDISKISVEEYVNMFKEYYDKISKLLGITKVDVNEELKIYNSITSS